MKKYISIGILIIILGVIFIPKILSEGDVKVKFKILQPNEVPQQLKEILPKYLAEERALSCRIDKDVFVVVTRGEKTTGGYDVTIDKIEKVKEDKDFNLKVFAKYKDPKPDEIVSQIITYPFTIVKTNLDKLPDTIKLEIQQEEK